ncbi:MAG: hypothetical protein EZS28_037246, partial [Streblomastix strix]
AYGQKLAQKEINLGRGVVKLGFTLSELFVQILSDGRIEVFNVMMEPVKSFNVILDYSKSMNQPQAILMAEIFENSVFMIGAELIVYEIEDIQISKLVEGRPATGLTELPICMCVGQFVQLSGNMEKVVWLATEQCELVQVGREGVMKRRFPQFGSIIIMQSSPDSRKLGILGKDWRLHILDIENEMREIMCASVAVCVSFRQINKEDGEDEDEFVIVTLQGTTKKINYDCSFHMCSEVDGLRIITNQSNIFFAPLHPSLDEVFGVGSLAPGAMLREAYNRYSKSSFIWTFIQR